MPALLPPANIFFYPRVGQSSGTLILASASSSTPWLSPGLLFSPMLTPAFILIGFHLDTNAGTAPAVSPRTLNKKPTYAGQWVCLLMRREIQTMRNWRQGKSVKDFSVCSCHGGSLTCANFRFPLTSWQACLILSTVPSSPKYCKDSHSGRARSLSAGLFDVRPETKV